MPKHQFKQTVSYPYWLIRNFHFSLQSLENPISTRDHLIDNIKALLIMLVVIGHFYEPYVLQNNIMKAVYICIYSFHMPLFVFISGYLSKSESSGTTFKLLTGILVPYLLFSFIWHLRQSIHTGDWYLDILSPPFHLWYLLSLFIWRLLLPFFKLIKYPLLFSIIISILIGLSSMNNNILSLSRTLGLLPFFLAGAFCEPSRLHDTHQKKHLAVLGVIILMGIIGCVFTNHARSPRLWNMVFWQLSYHEAQLTNVEGILFRLLLMLIAAAVSLSVVVLSSTKKLSFTNFGAKTLTIYIFHGFFVPSFSKRFSIWNQNIVIDILIIIFPFLLVFLLSLTSVEKFYNYVINFVVKAFLRLDR
jgi:fucose 4-O-acetylase-like acetyltransferase